MKSFISFVLVICSFLSFLLPITQTHAEENDENYFIVTAYYSPLPDQKHYLTGNYEDEVVLNGQGVSGASGKKVFSGMLAAPASYSFGTKIYLDGLGIGEVSDRGGAIVPAGQRGYNYDRIDVWMGYGDEGLKRAMFWGKRKVYGYVIDSGNTVTLSYDSIPAPNWTTQNLATPPIQETRPDIFDTILSAGTNSEEVGELQSILVELGYLKGEAISKIYDANTISAIYDFQINTNILRSENDTGAGVYGPKTRKELRKLYEVYQSEKKLKEDFEKKILPLQEQAFDTAEKVVISLEKPVYGEISPRVRELQKTLAKLGYFPYKDTAIFGVKTQNALLEYQKKKELITSINDQGAGTFGPQTRAQFTKDLAEFYFQELLQEKNLIEEYKKYYEAENIISSEATEKVSLSDLSTKI